MLKGMAHVTGGLRPRRALGSIYIATMLGVKQVYCGRYTADSVVALFQREKVTLSHCVPTILRMLLDSAKTTGINLSGWKMIIGGAALPQALAREALPLSGLMPKMNSWAFERQVEMRCKPGRALPLAQIRIVDGEMNDLPHDGKTSGELVARAPWLTQGYLKDLKSSEKLWEGDWLHTGDLATIDADGYVKITDRLKDVIKSGGEWISSLQLEDLILRHPGVAEAAVIGMRSKMDRAAAGAVGCQAGAGGQRGANQDTAAQLCRKGHHPPLQRAGANRLRGGFAQDQRRQTRQEGVARTVRNKGERQEVGVGISQAEVSLRPYPSSD